MKVKHSYSRWYDLHQAKVTQKKEIKKAIDRGTEQKLFTMRPSTSNRIMLPALLFLLIGDLQLLASLRPETVTSNRKTGWLDRRVNIGFCIPQSNRFHLNRFMCTILKPSVVQSAHCVAKYISRSHLKIDYQIIYTEPIQNLWLHSQFYYKFNGIVYSSFPIDLWENLCDFFDGKIEKAMFSEWLFSKLEPFSNFNHSCPYSSFIVKAENVSMDKTFSFDRSILPSGRYRIDVSLAKENRIPFLDMKIFGTNGEHYFEKI